MVWIVSWLARARRASALLLLCLCLGIGLGLAAPSAHAGVLENVLEPGETIEGHAKAEKDCGNCHSNFNRTAQDTLCTDCHKEIARDLREKHGFHGKMTRETCRNCHGDHKGRAAKIAEFNQQTFNHKLTEFRLEGGHLKPKCTACHVAGKKYREAQSTCNGCHRKDDKHKQRYGPKCETCHSVANWKDMLFDHDRDTKYPLHGKHITTKCDDCHTGDLYKDKLQTDCVSCHKKDDKHKGTLGPDCGKCHTERNWKDEKFDHDKTRFPLEGKHEDTECKACHKTAVFKDAPRDCLSCHKKDDKHKGNFGPKCESCHNAESWKVILFDHTRDTKYPLRGKHHDVKCTDCHSGDLYKDKLKEDCFSCHEKDDKHKGTLGKRCEDCHIEKDWKDTANRFDHSKTKFPLLGKHDKIRCDDCHKSKVYNEAPKDCIGCHKKDDTHKGRYGLKCETCHNANLWKGKEIIFDHDRDTKYPLRGKHITTKCDDCHKGDLYKDKLKEDCLSCHKKDDKHEGQEGPKCERCHVEKDWKTIVRFDHGLTKFPLLGKHEKVECKKCHESPRFKDAKSDCVSCHDKDDQKVHRRRLGTLCEICHNARDWKKWDYDHDLRTHFKLDGGHKGLDCYACHKQPMAKRAELSMACGACHSGDDVHEGKFGKACDQCHVTSKWKIIKEGAGNRRSMLWLPGSGVKLALGDLPGPIANDDLSDQERAR